MNIWKTIDSINSLLIYYNDTIDRIDYIDSIDSTMVIVSSSKSSIDSWATLVGTYDANCRSITLYKQSSQLLIYNSTAINNATVDLCQTIE